MGAPDSLALPQQLGVTRPVDVTVAIQWSRQGISSNESKTITGTCVIDRTWNGEELAVELCRKYHDFFPPAAKQPPIPNDCLVDMKILKAEGLQFAAKTESFSRRFEQDSSRGKLCINLESDFHPEKTMEGNTVHVHVHQRVSCDAADGL